MSALSTVLSRWVNYGRNILFPPTCVFCHAPLATDASACPSCTEGIHIWPLAHCRLCGRSLSPALAPGPCGHCLRRPPPQKQTESLFIYQGAVRDALLEWKLRGQDAGIEWLLDAADTRLNQLFDANTLLLPVPMPLPRMRRAGHHHAADLCGAMTRRTSCRTDWRILCRCGQQPRQSTLGGRARWQNLSKAFVINSDHWHNIHNPVHVWVVDDIMTTGATMHFACRALKRAGIDACALSLTRLATKE